MMDDEPPFVSAAKEYQRRYYLAHREEKIEYQRRYHAEHRAEISARRRVPSSVRKNQHRGIPTVDGEYNRRYHLEVKADLLLRERIHALQRVSGLARPVCSRCGEGDLVVLAINHRNGDGGAERRLGRDGRWIVRAIVTGKREVDDLDVLCANCNIRFEFDRGRRRLPRDWQVAIDEEVAAWQEHSTA